MNSHFALSDTYGSMFIELLLSWYIYIDKLTKHIPRRYAKIVEIDGTMHQQGKYPKNVLKIYVELTKHDLMTMFRF